MMTSIYKNQQLPKNFDMTALAVRAMTQAKLAVAPAASAVREGDAVSLSEDARSKVPELARTAKALPGAATAGVATAGERSGGTGDRGLSVIDELRKGWTQELVSLVRNQAQNAGAIRVSREKGEVWLHDPNASDPAQKYFRMEIQPEDFNSYMKQWEDTHKGNDEYIPKLQARIAALDEPPPAQTPAPASVDATA